MRILSGQFRGKYLSAGSDLSIRPITNRLKETLFSILHDSVVEKKILDLFSGSGSLGIEALSRGARHVTFVDSAESSIEVLNKNLNNLKRDQISTTVVKSDALTFITKNKNKYHLIFSDPPFRYASLQELINQVFSKNCLEVNGVLIVHHEIDNPFQTEDVSYTVLKQKKIGRSLLSFISKETENG
jgi:16S rRNA (guanine(966)-N(2))-methyltransferase RsmD